MDFFFGCLNRDVVVKNLTILAPLDSPNTDGVDPGEFLVEPRIRILTIYLYLKKKFLF